MKGYFVEDLQDTSWLSITNWGLFNSISSVREVITGYDDFHEGCEEDESVCENNKCALAKLPTYQLLEIWQFRLHRATPSQFDRFGYVPSDIKREWR